MYYYYNYYYTITILATFAFLLRILHQIGYYTIIRKGIGGCWPRVPLGPDPGEGYRSVF